MPVFTQKYAIVQLLEPMPVGAQFSSDNWPLHSTIVDTFAIDWDAAKMAKQLEILLSPHTPAYSIVEGDTFFGPELQTHVMLLQKTESLTGLHEDVLALLEQGGLVLLHAHPYLGVLRRRTRSDGDSWVWNAAQMVADRRHTCMDFARRKRLVVEFQISHPRYRRAPHHARYCHCLGCGRRSRPTLVRGRPPLTRRAMAGGHFLLSVSVALADITSQSAHLCARRPGPSAHDVRASSALTQPMGALPQGHKEVFGIFVL